MNAHSMVMAYRPMSHMLRAFVVPDIDARAATERLKPTELPFQVMQFRMLQVPGKSVIEINEAVNVLASVKVTRPMSIKVGQPITLADIDPAQCFLEPPTLDGKRAAFFLCRSAFLHLHHDVRLHARCATGSDRG